jgi:hypothetical protein
MCVDLDDVLDPQWRHCEQPVVCGIRIHRDFVSPHNIDKEAHPRARMFFIRVSRDRRCARRSFCRRTTRYRNRARSIGSRCERQGRIASTVHSRAMIRVVRIHSRRNDSYEDFAGAWPWSVGVFDPQDLGSAALSNCDPLHRHFSSAARSTPRRRRSHCRRPRCLRFPCRP